MLSLLVLTWQVTSFIILVNSCVILDLYILEYMEPSTEKFWYYLYSYIKTKGFTIDTCFIDQVILFRRRNRLKRSCQKTEDFWYFESREITFSAVKIFLFHSIRFSLSILVFYTFYLAFLLQAPSFQDLICSSVT